MTITAVVPVSPIPGHPDTAIIEETLHSIRHHLPNSEILLTFDGVRDEQKHRRGDYEEAIRRTLWICDKHYGGTVPFIFEEHRHQAGMMRAAITEIRTPMLMYVEQDTPLVTDEPIDFAAITAFIESGQSNCVRLHHEGRIPADHTHLMHGYQGSETFLRTSQWSQRPHIASTAYYRRLLDSHFTDNSRCFLEDRLHGILDNAYRNDGINGWLQHRLHIYAKDPNNLKRSYHLDGRAGDPKYEDRQVWA